LIPPDLIYDRQKERDHIAERVGKMELFKLERLEMAFVEGVAAFQY